MLFLIGRFCLPEIYLVIVRGNSDGLIHGGFLKKRLAADVDIIPALSLIFCSQYTLQRFQV